MVPLLGPLNTRCRIILRTQKGIIILTATQHESYLVTRSGTPSKTRMSAWTFRRSSLLDFVLMCSGLLSKNIYTLSYHNVDVLQIIGFGNYGNLIEVP